jgi:hypothetical protein
VSREKYEEDQNPPIQLVFQKWIDREEEADLELDKSTENTQDTCD